LRTYGVAEDCLRYLAPLNDLAIERIRRPLVEDLLADVASHAPRRAEMAFSLLKRILKGAEDRGQQVDRAIYGIRIARADEREPRFLTWDEMEELQSWMPEYVSRIVPVGILTMLRRGEILGLRDHDLRHTGGVVDDRRRLPREGDRRADGPLGRRRARPEALRAPLQGRPPPSGDRVGIARFHGASRFRCTEDVR
jgi:integrase